MSRQTNRTNILFTVVLQSVRFSVVATRRGSLGDRTRQEMKKK
jgi:hypothetical protein